MAKFNWILFIILIVVAVDSGLLSREKNPTRKPTSASAVSAGGAINKGAIECSFSRKCQNQSSKSHAKPEVEKELIKTAREVGFPESEIENVLRHSYCESRWRADASNRYRGGHVGYMQIQINHHKEFGERIGASGRAQFQRAMRDTRNNLQVAYWLWEKDKKKPAFSNIRDGYGPWKATINCRKSNRARGVPWKKIITVYEYGVELS